MRKREGGLLWPLLWLYLPAGLALLAVFVASRKTGLPVAMFTRDPADITHSSPFLGVLSNLGILLWCATAAVCLFAFQVLRQDRGRKKTALFLLLAGLITILLLLDDLFLLHERVFPRYLHWRQRYPYYAYFSLTAAYLVAFRKIILKSDFRMLAAAFVFFALSIAVDAFTGPLSQSFPSFHLFEDGFKLFGLASWLGYFGQFAWQAVTGRSAAESGDG
jgi:hypothetical protein